MSDTDEQRANDRSMRPFDEWLAAEERCRQIVPPKMARALEVIERD